MATPLLHPTRLAQPPVTAQALIANDRWPKAIGLAALSQTPVAVGDLFAARVLRSLSTGDFAKADAAALLACHLAPHVLKAASRHASSHWLLQATRYTDKKIAGRLFGKTEQWVEGRPRVSEHTHRIANDLPWVIGMLVGFAPNGAEAFGGLAVQIGMLALLMEPKVALSLAAALGIAMAFGKLSETVEIRQVERSKQGGEETHCLFGRSRSRYWDNVTLGNSYNFRRWRQEFIDISHAYWSDEVTREVYASSIAAVSQAAGAVVMGGTLLLYGQKLWDSGEHEKFITVFLPLAARAAGIVGQTQAAMLNSQQFLKHLRILRRVLGQIQQDAVLQPRNFFSDSLDIRDVHARAYRAHSFFEDKAVYGRYTVRGHNGDGKSMLLAALKAQGAQSAFLWPSVNDLMFGDQLGSSGQTTVYALATLKEDLHAYPGLTTVLLDEWDANLDSKNRLIVNAMLDEMAATHRLLEVTHSESQKA